MERVKQFAPEIDIDAHEAAALALITSNPGWSVYHKICRHAVDKYILALINLPSGSDHAVVEGHRCSKVAAQFYEEITNRINAVVKSYMDGQQSNDGPLPDLTEGIIDFGPPASTADDFDVLEEAQNTYE